MTKLNQIFALDPEPPQQVHVSFNDEIDFCVWTLEQDGLHAPFFDLHPPGTGSLQLRGLTMAQWQQWFYTVIRQQDPALFWNAQGFDALTWTETQLSTYQQMAEQIQTFPEFEQDSISSICFDRLRSTLLHHYHVYQQRQDEAKHRCGEAGFGRRLPVLQNPTDAFIGMPEVRQHLQTLWQQYQELYGEYSRIQCPSRVIHTMATNLELLDLPGLNIFVVGYPAVTEFLLPPNGIVVSHLQIQSDASLQELIHWAAHELNHSNLSSTW
ncbi:hypothetical protein ACQ4M3_37210 [Leptolyngbya sp. AN03gr2]|uniref:hypothetical protein n=1 Tax=unclassified Leptolyngbya TaxID=2650499 RepID=UPI003D321405